MVNVPLASVEVNFGICGFPVEFIGTIIGLIETDALRIGMCVTESRTMPVTLPVLSLPGACAHVVCAHAVTIRKIQRGFMALESPWLFPAESISDAPGPWRLRRLRFPRPM